MRYLLGIVLVAFLAVPALAAFQATPGQQGGFSGPGSQPAQMTVQQVKTMSDDTRVTLIGNIIAQLPHDHDKYTFRDATGQITVDIDKKDFRGQTVTPQNTVRIYGEVDKDFGKPVEIDVKTLEVLK